MLRSKLFQEGADWVVLERFVCDIQIAHSRGQPRLQTIVEAFSKSSVASFRRLSSECLPEIDFFDEKRLVDRLKFTSLDVKLAFEIIFPRLVLERDGRCRLASASNLLSRFAGYSRLISQHLAQARAQCLFLVFFVPVVSSLFVFGGAEHFSSNLQNRAGQVFFLIAFLLYICGSWILFLFLKRTHAVVFTQSLALPSGQASLIRKLLKSSVTRMGSHGVLGAALEESGHQWLAQTGRALLWGVVSRESKCSLVVGSKQKDEFLDAITSTYLWSPIEVRERWLERTHDFLMSAIQEQLAQKAASLNLQLVLVMAIFFLPALFLMLWLSGTPSSPGTIS